MWTVIQQPMLRKKVYKNVTESHTSADEPEGHWHIDYR